MRRVGLIVLLLAALVCPAQAGEVRYRVVNLGDLGGNYVYVRDINNSGQVTGYATGAAGGANAFLWEDGVMQRLPSLNEGSSMAEGIDEAGNIVGSSWANPYGVHACLWRDGIPEDVGYSETSTVSEAAEISNNGQIVGYFEAFNKPDRAFMWDNGTITDLGTLPVPDWFWSDSRATAINDSGQVVGWAEGGDQGRMRAALWENGVIQDLGALGPGDGASGQARDINNKGQVVGFATDGVYLVSRAFLWEEGVMRDLGILELNNWSKANGINESGQVVGSGSTRYGERAFIWENGVMTDLNTLIPSDSGWRLDRATAINDSGWIVGEGLLTGYAVWQAGFLLIPVPEPTSIAALCAGLVCIGAARRRQRA